jgi:hypothetical protein
MEAMKRLLFLLAVPLFAADLSSVRSVYVMPMYRGLEQYLANRLTNEQVFQVVTDAKLADSFFTDRIGEYFQMQLESLTSPENAEPAPEPAKAQDNDTESSKPLMTETVNKLDNPALNSAFGRGKGTVFLVDAKSKRVIWSTYRPASSSAGKEMDRAASDIVSRLKKDMGMKK